MDKIEEVKTYHFFKEKKLDPFEYISAMALVSKALKEAETAESIDIKIEIKKLT